MATHERVHPLINFPFFDQIGLSWLNIKDVTPVCRAHMEQNPEFQRQLERKAMFTPMIGYASKQHPPLS